MNKAKRSQSQSKINHTKQQVIYCLRTGKRILDKKEIISNINKNRVQSYKKISFTIRKMDAIFKDKHLNQTDQQIQLPIARNNMAKTQYNNSMTKTVYKNTIVKTEQAEQYGSIKINKQKLKLTTQTFPFKQSQQLSPIKPSKNLVWREDKSHKYKLGSLKNRVNTQYDYQAQKNNKQKIIDQIDSPLKLSKLTKEKQKQKNIIQLIAHQKNQNSLLSEIPGIKFKRQQSKQQTKGKDISYGNKGGSQNDISLSPIKRGHQTSIFFHSKSNSILSKTKSSYLHFDQLINRDSDKKIQDMYNIRNESCIYQQPKQWQYYNILNLKQLSLCRTNLKLSCQNWVLIDYNELKYLRGWHAKEVKQCSIACKLFISNIIIHLKYNLKINLQKIKLRINNNLINRKIQSTRKGDKQYCLNDNTIISLWDIFVGTILTTKLDLQWHLILGIGYLYKNYNCYGESFESQNLAQYNNYIYMTDKNVVKQYEHIFLLICKQITTKLRLEHFTFQSKIHRYVLMKGNKFLTESNEQYNNSLFKEQENQLQYLMIYGSCIETSVLFMQCMSCPQFNALICNSESYYLSDIRYQVGFKFWQNRKHKFTSQFCHEKQKNNTFLCSMNKESHYWSYLSYNWVDKVVIVCNEVRTNMWTRDNDYIIDWMRQTIRRYSPQKTKPTFRK